ncbi:predicted protein [Sclerotinia sclerotiorum 1980 UF-70]|uniref:Uncharacterized protein n=1 Tax=Sclerotinia sclerotiorum (strain ATCC 18683 / 1980 / Ss-1) TaxID=665079 RepID=A7E667_SCLS1|nr:predicted protein [Sclerotinia sclerotiorum 1980 UF-70]EDN91389.1 predicted protein [Sclerotinia sclerotiorum 1980 UF-70]
MELKAGEAVLVESMSTRMPDSYGDRILALRCFTSYELKKFAKHLNL